MTIAFTLSCSHWEEKYKKKEWSLKYNIGEDWIIN